MAYETPHVIAYGREGQWTAITFPVRRTWYTQLLLDGRLVATPGHLCGRRIPVRFLTVSHKENELTLYYGGKNEDFANEVSRKEPGSFVIACEVLDHAPTTT
jgi:hypothetical protein